MHVRVGKALPTPNPEINVKWFVAAIMAATEEEAEITVELVGVQP